MATHSKIARRSLFTGFGAAAFAVVAARISPPPQLSTVLSPKRPDSPGYQLTEHVKKYYRTTTI